MDNQNKNQNFGLEENEDDYSEITPSWMVNSSDNDEEDEAEDNFTDQSLISDQEIDIDEYDENDKNPVLGSSVIEGDEGDFDGHRKDQENEEDSPSVLDLSENEEESEEFVKISKSKVILIKKLLKNIKDNCVNAENLLGGIVNKDDEERINISEATNKVEDEDENSDTNKVIEGVFDGENMVGPDGKQYNVPPNYASKSKLVEGDLLKLAITHKGTFVYKQIKPTERDRVVGTLEKTLDGNFVVVSGSKKWRILTASVTYFKGEAGDETVILVPRAGDSKWAAVENIIRNAR